MNISSWIEKWAVATPEKVAIRFEEQEITYPELNDRIKSAARMLKNKLGVAPGDCVAYLGQNHPQTLMLVFACARLGAIFVPLNWRLAPAEHLHMLTDSGAVLLFVDEPFAEQCKELDTETPVCQVIAVNPDTTAGWPCLTDLAGTGDDCYPDIGVDYPLFIFYTSGTTGKPKGAVLKQEAIQYNAYNSVILHDMSSEDRILTFLPLFHVGGMNNQTTAGFYAGATVILHRTFDPQRVLDSIVQDKPTLTIILPAHMPGLRGLPDWEQSDFSSLRSVMTGSTSIADEMTRYWHNKGIPLLQVYGATETCPIAIHQVAGNAFSTEGCIGFPAMHCDIRIVEGEDRDCATSEPGQILVRGKNVMSHYWNNEEATRENLVDGWFYSGDIGYVDETGCYHFVDRKKDVIISGGENIYPAEIENVLMDHPDIVEVSVVGRKDPKWGEAPVAVIATRDNAGLEEDSILEWLTGKLGRYKYPRAVLFVDELPKNAMRKVEKNKVRRMVNDRDA